VSGSSTRRDSSRQNAETEVEAVRLLLVDQVGD